MNQNSKAPAGLVERPENLFKRRSRDFFFVLKKVFRRYLIQFLVCYLMIILSLFFLRWEYFQRFEFVALDAFFKLRGPQVTDSRIAYIEIAEDSIEALGRWPWPRRYHAAMTHILHEWGARAILFDIMFSEESDPLDDGALEEALEEASDDYLAILFEHRNNETSWIHSLPRFEKHAAGLGHINVTPDPDGVLRRVKPFIQTHTETEVYLPFRFLFDYLKDPSISPKSFPFPRDESGSLLVNWAGKWTETFEHYSFVDILRSYEAVQHGRAPIIKPDELKGKICLIGVTAAGHTDIKANPLESIYPAIGLHGNVINNILMGQMLQEAPLWVNALILFVIGMMASILFVIFQSLISFVLGLLLGVVWIGIAYILFAQYGVWCYVMHPLILIFGLYIFSSVYNLVLQKKEHWRLFQLSIRDGLTGLYVIRYFRELLNEAVGESRMRKKPLSLIILDIDYFKKVNDTHGHVAGDMVLKEMAKVLKELTRHKRSPHLSDIVARYGGEEFVLLLRNCKLNDALFFVAERLRKTVENHTFKYNDIVIPVTISVGVATLHPGENVPDLMVLRADAALYRAKHEGRNRCCLELPEDNNPTPSK